MPTPTALPSSFTAGDVLTAANMNLLRGGFRILQVASTTKTDTFVLNSSTYTDVTGLSVSITPQATTNKILVLCTLNGVNDASTDTNSIQLVRDSTAIAIGDAAGNRIQASTTFFTTDNNALGNAAIVYLDSPATTSATTYKIQIRANQGANYTAINRCENDTNAAVSSRTASTIAVLEVSA